MHVNHEDVGCMGDFTKEDFTTQHIHHTTYHRDLVPNNTYFGTNKAQGFKLLQTKPLSNNSFT